MLFLRSPQCINSSFRLHKERLLLQGTARLTNLRCYGYDHSRIIRQALI